MSCPEMNKRRPLIRVSFRGLLARIALATAMISLVMGQLWAGVGTTLVLPARNVRPRSRLVMKLDTRWTQADGICPVRLQFTPVGSRVFPADRTLQVTICPKSWGGVFQPVTQLVQTVQISEGATDALATVYLPVDNQSQVFSIEVREGGRLLRDISADDTALTRVGYRMSSNLLTVLVVDKDVSSLYFRQVRPVGPAAESLPVPDVRKLISLVGQPINYNGMIPTKGLSWLELSDLTTNIEYVPPQDLPAHITGLASTDLVMIDLEELREFAQQHVERFEILRHWLMLGGNLCVSHAGASFQELTELERTLRLMPAAVPSQWQLPHEALRDVVREASSGGNIDDRKTVLSSDEIRDIVGPTSYRDEWCFPERDNYALLNVNIQNSRNNVGMQNAKLDFGALPDAPPFALRRAHLGTVIAFRGDLAEVPQESWNWLVNSFPRSCYSWESRFGMSLSSPNEGYWDFLIPGVGLPPVTAFHVLLTLFVIGIGPLNYFWLQRYRRLNWLLVTVPLGAGITIVGLVAFAVLIDGLAARGRVRSLTHIDQRTGDVASWSRQSYYAGVAPSDGLSFPQDAIVFPIDFMPPHLRSVFAGSRRIQQREADRVRYQVGYFPSRTTVQFAVALAGQTKRGIHLVAAAAGERPTVPAAVTNQLGAAAKLILVRAHDASLHAAEDLADGETRPLHVIDQSALVRYMGQVFREHTLSPPPGFDRSLMQNGMLMRRFGQRGVSNRDGILEHALTRLAAGHGVIDQPDSYVAVVDRSIHTPLGLETVVESNSLYVVTGRVPPFESP